MSVIDVDRRLPIGESPAHGTLALQAPSGVEPAVSEAWVASIAPTPEQCLHIDSELLSLCAQQHGLRAQLTAFPPLSGYDSPARVIGMTRDGASRVIRLQPAQRRGFPLRPWVLSPLPEHCEREGLALALDYWGADAPDWVEVVEFARAYPPLPMVLLGRSLLNELAAPAALEAAPNLIVETSEFCPRLCDLVSEFGAHRFIYGSGAFAATANQAAPAPAEDVAAERILVENARELESGRWREDYL